MKKLSTLYFIVFLFFSFYTYEAKCNDLVIGAGPEYFIPTGDLNDLNKPAFGIKLEISGKQFCKLWYSARIDYTKLKHRKNNIGNSFDDVFMLSPVIKYAPFSSDCYNRKFSPFVEGMLSLSIADGNDGASETGVGAGAGLGISYGFKMFKRCSSLDLDAVYSAPNCIWKDDDRIKMKMINVALTLNIAL